MNRISALFLIAVGPLTAAAQAPTLPLAQSKLDASAADPRYRVPLDSTSSLAWLGSLATAPRWSLDGEWFYFQYSLDPGSGEAASAPWWRVSKDGKRIEVVTRDDAARLPPAGVQYTKDLSRAVWSVGGQILYWKRGGVTEILLARDRPAGVPRWTNDERAIRWREENNLFELHPESGSLRQLTKALVQTEPPRPDKLKDQLRLEQQTLFDFVKRQMAMRDSTAMRALALANAQWKPFAVPIRPNEVVRGVAVPPNGKYVTYLTRPRAPGERTNFSEYVNESGIVVNRTSRPKVGRPAPIVRVAIVPANSALHEDSVKATYVDATGFGKAATPISAVWNPQGTRFVVEFQSVDGKDRWIVLVDPATGERTRELHHIHDPAWFGGPDRNPGNGLFPSWMQWLPDGEALAITSEETGWNHLYLIAMDGTRTPVTSGSWEVRSVNLARDESKWWIEAGIEHPNERHLYEVDLRGGPPRRIDQLGEGEITPFLSPDGRTLALRWASPTRLADLHVMPANGESAPVRVTRSGTDAFWKIAWVPSDFVQFPDDMGKPVFARVYKPKTQNSTRAAVMYIHGAGYAQGVHKAFGPLNMYAQHLAERGVTYVLLDYRGSAGYGRDMRTDIYRSIGDRDVKSAVAAIAFLEKNYRVSPKHVGLYGASYGGLFTLMALFKYPGVFRAGAAQSAVTDFAHYGHDWPFRVLNGAPSDDTAAYRASSPIWHAAGLQDRLLIQHGLVDDNVEFQDAARLVQRLIELGKDFEFVMYPIEGHGWSTRWSRIDSQRRVTKLWEETILKR